MVTFLAAVVLVTTQEKTYESKATFFLRPHSSLLIDDEILRALDTLSGRTEINNTYAEVASSKALHDRVAERLDLPPDIQQALRVSGRAIAGTNVLELIVSGPEPLVVKRFADAVSTETVSYVSNLYDVFELQALDEAATPTTPVSPKIALILPGSVILGLILGAGLVFLVDFWKREQDKPEGLEILDHETGIHNRDYFMLRLKEEISRARRNNYMFTLALVELNFPEQNGVEQSTYKIEVLRRLIMILGSRLREEDIMSRYDETKLALILLDYGEEPASVLIEELIASMGSLSTIDAAGDAHSGPQISAALLGFHNGGDWEDVALLGHLEKSLKKSHDAGDSGVTAYTDSDIGTLSVQDSLAPV